MRRCVYRPQNSSLLEQSESVCDQLNAALNRGGSRLCSFDGFLSNEHALLFLPGTCTMDSTLVETISGVLQEHGISDWNWELCDNGVHIRFKRGRPLSIVHVFVVAVLLHVAWAYWDVHKIHVK